MLTQAQHGTVSIARIGVVAFAAIALLAGTRFAFAQTQGEIVRAHRSEGVGPEEVVLTLERTECLGSCPAYRLTLSAAGRVEYEGRRYVKETGVHTGDISQEAVLLLVNRLLGARLFDADSEYVGSDRMIRFRDRLILGRGAVSDADSVILSLTVGDYSKTVRVVDADPLGLREVADEIDKAVAVEKWIGTLCERPRAPIGPHLRPGQCEAEKGKDAEP